MLLDIVLLSGCICVGAGVLRILAQIADRQSPLRGIALALIGLGCLSYAYYSSDHALTIYDASSAVYRVIGAIL